VRVRRTVVLAGLVVLGATLVVLVRAPVRPRGQFAVRGHRVFGVGRGAVRAIEVALEGRRFSARRTAEGWEIDGRRASPGTAAALDDLLETVVGLRAVDSFRSRDRASYGLERPHATIEVGTARGVRRLVLGDMNAAGSAFYARRSGDPRVLQVGSALLSELERVFFNRDEQRKLAAGDRVLGLAGAARAAAEGAHLLEEEQSLVPVAPAEEETPVAEHLDAREALRLGRQIHLRRRRAGLARAGAAEVPEGEDAVVPVPPQHTERVAPDLGQLLDAGGVRRARARHAATLEKRGGPHKSPPWVN